MALSLYTKLPPGAACTRLLEVRPASDPSDDIDCELKIFEIEHAPSYKAISYAWKEQLGVGCEEGDPWQRGSQLEIIIGPWSRIPLTVSPSLMLAVRRLRLRSRVQHVWIDAVCINQQDDEERTEQVALMGKIYEQAFEVVIWLGERQIEDELGEWLQGIYSRTTVNVDFSHDEQARWLVSRYIDGFATLRDKYNGPVTPKTDIYGAFCLVWLLAQGHKSSDIQFYHNNLFQNRFRMEWASQVSSGLRAIMARDWWRRAWVVQETVLARKATVVYGQLSAPWMMFASAAINVTQQKHGQDIDQLTILGQLPIFSFQHRADAAGPLDDFAALVLSIEYTRIEREQGNPVQLLSLLRRFRTRKATDDRDKIIAFQGLANVSTTRPLAINYKMSKQELFTAATTHIIEQTQSLSVLHGDVMHSKPEELHSMKNLSITEFPSWVTDWSALPTDGVVEMDRLNRLKHYSAGDVYKPVHIHDENVLETGGYIIGMVASVAEEVPQPTLERLRQAISSWCAWWLENTQQPEGPINKSIFYSAVCGQLLYVPQAGQNSQEGEFRRSGTLAIQEACKLWLTGNTTQRNRKTAMIGDLVTNSYQEPTSITQMKNSYFYSVRTASSSRKLFTFYRGGRIYRSNHQLPQKEDIGIGPLNTQVGDIIYIPDGSNVPLLIRREPHRKDHPSTWAPSFPRAREGHTRQTLDGKQQPSTSICRSVHTMHRLIGDAYVHGFMDGEALSEHRHPEKTSIYFC